MTFFLKTRQELRRKKGFIEARCPTTATVFISKSAFENTNIDIQQLLDHQPKNMSTNGNAQLNCRIIERTAFLRGNQRNKEKAGAITSCYKMKCHQE